MSREEIVRSVHRYNIVRSVLFFENKIICVLESMLPARGGISSRRRIWRKAKRHFSNAAGETKLPLARPGKGLCGAPGGNRTHNLRRRRPTLYPIALRVHAKRFPVLSLSPSRRRSARRKENFGCNEARQGSAIFLPLPFYRLLFSYVQRALSASFPPLRGEAGASPLLRALFLRSLSPLPRKSR